MAEKICGICNKKLDFRTEKSKCADGFVCKECLYTAKKDPSFPDFEMRYITYTMIKRSYQVGEEIEAELRAAKEEEDRRRREQLEVIAHFKPTDDFIQAQFDDRSRQMIASECLKSSRMAQDYKLFSYDQIVGYEIIESYGTRTEDVVDRAIMGGLLAGGAGAVVGAATGKSEGVCEYLGVQVTLKDYEKPCIFVPFIKDAVSISGFIYKTNSTAARQMASKIALILQRREEESREGVANPGIADEIIRLKELFDAGILTQEEFEAAKRKAVGL